MTKTIKLNLIRLSAQRSISAIRDIRFLRNSPITPQKGLKGKPLHSKQLVNQKRANTLVWFSDHSSMRFYQKAPMVLYNIRNMWFEGKRLFFFKSGSGLIFIMKNLELNHFGFFLHNFRTIVPNFKTALSPKQLLFVKVGSRVTKVRDVFKPSVVFASAHKSTARVIFFDR